MSKKIFRSIMAVTLIVFVAVFITAIGFLYNYFVKLQVSRLKDELTIVSASVNDEGVKYFDKFNSSVLILSILVDTFISKISLPMRPVPEIRSISGA